MQPIVNYGSTTSYSEDICGLSNVLVGVKSNQEAITCLEEEIWRQRRNLDEDLFYASEGWKTYTDPNDSTCIESNVDFDERTGHRLHPELGFQKRVTQPSRLCPAATLVGIPAGGICAAGGLAGVHLIAATEANHLLMCLGVMLTGVSCVPCFTIPYFAQRLVTAIENYGAEKEEKRCERHYLNIIRRIQTVIDRLKLLEGSAPFKMNHI